MESYSGEVSGSRSYRTVGCCAPTVSSYLVLFALSCITLSCFVPLDFALFHPTLLRLASRWLASAHFTLPCLTSSHFVSPCFISLAVVILSCDKTIAAPGMLFTLSTFSNLLISQPGSSLFIQPPYCSSNLLIFHPTSPFFVQSPCFVSDTPFSQQISLFLSDLLISYHWWSFLLHKQAISQLCALGMLFELTISSDLV